MIYIKDFKLLEKAAEELHKCITIYKKIYGENSREMAVWDIYYNMEHTYIEQGRHNEAQQYKTKAKKIEEYLAANRAVIARTK
ncbi:MAG: hypothetical protein MRQ09_06355 [Candidatus Midichloria sp.]|nr:hypothetical protein [Candidatus Midichloria sp.]